jgi:hypothetical protein
MTERFLYAAMLVSIAGCAHDFEGTWVGTVHTLRSDGTKSTPTSIGVNITSPGPGQLTFSPDSSANNVLCNRGAYPLTKKSETTFTADASGIRCHITDVACRTNAFVFNGGHGEMQGDTLTATFDWTVTCEETGKGGRAELIYELKRQ